MLELRTGLLMRAALATSVIAKRSAQRTGPCTHTREEYNIVPGLLRFTGAVERDPAIATLFDAQPSELRSLATAWFGRIRRCGADVRELMHDGLATACVDDAPFAYVGVFKAHVNVGFFHGASLPDGARLLVGSGRHMRHVKLEPGIAFDEAALDALIAEAYGDIGRRVMLAD